MPIAAMAPNQSEPSHARCVPAISRGNGRQVRSHTYPELALYLEGRDIRRLNHKPRDTAQYVSYLRNPVRVLRLLYQVSLMYLLFLEPGGYLHWTEQDPRANRIIGAPSTGTSAPYTEEALRFLDKPREGINFL